MRIANTALKNCREGADAAHEAGEDGRQSSRKNMAMLSALLARLRTRLNACPSEASAVPVRKLVGPT
jgi:Pyruvate/2-oxoacid:ferredoxin oxidoreductase gamma subunit